MMGLKLCVKKSRLGWIFEAQTASERTMQAYGRDLKCAALTPSYEGNNSDFKERSKR